MNNTNENKFSTLTFYVENMDYVKRVRDELFQLDIECQLRTDWSQEKIHFTVSLKELDNFQLNYLKQFLIKADVYEIKFLK